ncbi:hypothetical protein R3W88_019531 [Solanum pinnatisectum]|uniref:Uncharacterized protein n=1 Tax=Solanum pinnatisectum TaxID=50273 RepID=A0AAV9KJZ5_9SOLN|nr:hypothetical protein R3W88_019531 [Solanum pinnatisectum]
MLVSHITSRKTTSMDDMVYFANSAFVTLNWLGVDYGSFDEDIKNMIACKYNLLIAERRDMCFVSKL